MSLNNHFAEMLAVLNDSEAEYLIVGAYALAAYGNPRATGDIDILVDSSEENSIRVWEALKAFGAPLSRLKPSDLAKEDVVFQMGLPPNRIDLLTSISGIDFATAWKNRSQIEMNGVIANLICLEDLLENKLASGRPKDLVDADWLSKAIKNRNSTDND